MSKKKTLDTSEELTILRYGNGVKLVKPDTVNSNLPEGYALKSLLQLPLSFYLLNSDATTQKMNDEGVSVCGFESVAESLGKSIVEVTEKKSARTMIENCHDVMRTNEVKIFEEQHLRKDGISQQFLSVKSPWYDESNKIVGVCGFSIVLGKHSLANSLSIISNLGLLNNNRPANVAPQPFIGQHLKGVYLSKREAECLSLTIKGYTAKRIARELEISHRTVEEYIMNIRIKMNVSSKAELIEIAMGS